MLDPNVEPVRQVRETARFEERRRIDVSGAGVARDEKVEVALRSAEVIETGREPVGEVRIERPAKRNRAARFVVPKDRRRLIDPSGGVVVAAVNRDERFVDRITVIIDITATAEVVDRRFVLRINGVEREMLEERGVRHRPEPERVGVEVSVVIGKNFRVPPFGLDAAVFAAGVPVIGVFRIPRRETRDANHFSSAGRVVSGPQNGVKSVKIGAERLIRVVVRRFVVPRIEVEEEGGAGDSEVAVRQTVVLRRADRAANPVGVEVIPAFGRVEFAGFKVFFD